MTGGRYDVAGDLVRGDKVTQHGNHNVGVVRAGASGDDVAAILRFAEAVADRLDDVGLDDVRRREAARLVGEIRFGRRDRRVLRGLAATLRAILENAAANLVAAPLLELWRP